VSDVMDLIHHTLKKCLIVKMEDYQFTLGYKSNLK